MAWKIIQLETKCKIFVFLYAKITSSFLSAFLRKKKPINKKPKPFCRIGNGVCGVPLFCCLLWNLTPPSSCVPPEQQCQEQGLCSVLLQHHARMGRKIKVLLLN